MHAWGACDPSPILGTPIMSKASFPDRIVVTDQEIDISELSGEEKSFALNFLKAVRALYRTQGKERIIVGIAGPSGAGESLLAALAAKMSSGGISVTHISIDAFHYPNTYLGGHVDQEGRSPKEVKGRYDTYDVPFLKGKLEQFLKGDVVAFPEYSRKLHDPVSNAINISGPSILLLEGLWLLFESHGWGDLRHYFAKVYFLDNKPEKLRQHTIERHVRGGKTQEEAEDFFDKSDMKNYDLVMKTQSRADAQLTWPT